MLLLRNFPMFVSMGSALPHLGTMNGDMRTTLNPPLGNSGRFVHKYISKSASSSPRMSLFTDHADSEGEAIASTSPIRLRRTLSLSDGEFSASTCKNSESARSSSLIRLNTWVVSHPSLDEASELDLENPVENSSAAQKIQIQSERHLTSTSTPHPLGSSLISVKGEELDGSNLQVTSPNITESVDSFVETLHENYPLVSGNNEDHKYSSLQLGPNGVPLFCTAKGCRVAHVSESEYMSMGSGIQGREGKNCQVADDENSKSSRDMYYQNMLEANPGNPLLLSNYAKFLHEVQHDVAKADEYYGRAILASPGDAEVLSLYAKFIWETHKDAVRTQAYFDQAVKAAPDDCYVLSSYAHFLWNSEEEEEDQNDGSADLQNMIATICFGSVSAAA